MVTLSLPPVAERIERVLHLRIEHMGVYHGSPSSTPSDHITLAFVWQERVIPDACFFLENLFCPLILNVDYVLERFLLELLGGKRPQ